MKFSPIWDSARWWLYARAVGLRRAKVRISGPWIMGRISCLGLDVRKLLSWPLPLINTQKGRIDCLLAYRRSPGVRPHVAVMPRHYARND